MVSNTGWKLELMKALEPFVLEREIGLWEQSTARTGPPVLMRFLQLTPDSHFCLFHTRSIAYGLAVQNPTEKVNDKREEKRPALIPGCA